MDLQGGILRETRSKLEQLRGGLNNAGRFLHPELIDLFIKIERFKFFQILVLLLDTVNLALRRASLGR